MKYELMQRGIVVASVQGDDEDAVKSGIMHYAMMRDIILPKPSQGR